LLHGFFLFLKKPNTQRKDKLAAECHDCRLTGKITERAIKLQQCDFFDFF